MEDILHDTGGPPWLAARLLPAHMAAPFPFSRRDKPGHYWVDRDLELSPPANEGRRIIIPRAAILL